MQMSVFPITRHSNRVNRVNVYLTGARQICHGAARDLISANLRSIPRKKNNLVMILFKTIRNRHLHCLLKPQNPSNYIKNLPQNPYFLNSSLFSNFNEFSFISPIYWRPISLSAHFEPKEFERAAEKSQIANKPICVFFNQAVGISEKIQNFGIEAESGGENANLKEKLRNLEEEVRSMKKEIHEKEETVKLNLGKGDFIVRREVKRSLWALFADKKMKEVKLVDPTDLGNEDPMVYKELSSDMQMFAYHLYKKGYFDGASFMTKKFDFAYFEASYAREYLKFAAMEFGKDHQEIAKWLSAADLKKVALFGCPSIGQKSVNAAKNLRRFFEIEEHKVCQKCRMKESCKRANKRVHKGATKLTLADVTRVLVLYAMEPVPRQLVIAKEIKNCVSRLLNEIVNLSQTTSQGIPRTPF